MAFLIGAAPCPPCSVGAVCIEGRCQFPCQRDSDCHCELVCGQTKVCEPALPLIPGQPRMIRRGDATHPARFRHSGTVPTGYRLMHEPNWWGMVRGLIAFSAGYGATQLTASLNGTWRPEVLIPVAGPGFSYRPVDPAMGPVLAPFLNVMSVVVVTAEIVLQVVGLALIVAGVAVPQYWLELP